ncbi:MAG: phytoene/squalene synthase family protein [Promethearchaeota archaeon]
MRPAELIKKGRLKAEQVVKSSSSHLCKAISHIKDKERLIAFNVTYTIMRIVDDIVDEKQITGIPADREKIKKEVEKWKNRINKCYAGTPEAMPMSLTFFDVIQKFKMPKQLWDDFFFSMERDIENPTFDTFSEFKNYSLGATCAPTTAYLFLLLSEKNGETYDISNFDYTKVGRDLGIWAYMVHILRDVKKDTDNRLFYIPKNELSKFNLTYNDLIDFSESGKTNSDYSDFVEYYLLKADRFYDSSINLVKDYCENIGTDRLFSLFIIDRTYKAIENKIRSVSGNVFSDTKLLSETDLHRISLQLKKEIGV